jgi:RES domain-containing protein
MILFRIILEKYIGLSSSGAENRWNKLGEFVIYTGGSRSLSTLELVVHRDSIRTKETYKLMQFFIPDDPNFITQIAISDLPRDWRTRGAYSILQNIGSNWYKSKTSLILQVPSAIIPQEFNYIINTQHPLFSSVKHVDTEDYFWDNRLM